MADRENIIKILMSCFNVRERELYDKFPVTIAGSVWYELNSAGVVSFEITEISTSGEVYYEASVPLMRSGVAYKVVFDCDAKSDFNSFDDMFYEIERLEAEADRCVKAFGRNEWIR